MAVQFEPSGSPPSAPQRSHWYSNVIGAVPFQTPAFAKRERARAGVPEIEGSSVFTGGPVVVDFWTTSEAFDAAAAAPAEFLAMTCARRRLPMSAAVSA